MAPAFFAAPALGLLLQAALIFDGASVIRAATAETPRQHRFRPAMQQQRKLASAVGEDIVGTQAHEVGGRMRRMNTPRVRRERLSAITPMVWVHVPKTGTTFVNVLLRSVCPSWPKSAMMSDEMEAYGIPHLFELYPLDKWCPGGFAPEYPSPREGGHYGVSASFATLHHGKLIGMFRQPEARLWSAYTQHPYPWGWPQKERPEFAKYLSAASGCMTKSLVRDGWYPCKIGSPAVTKEEISMAAKRLRSFSFIGLTEEWGLSICLFHAMYGGSLAADELLPTRRSMDKPLHNPGAWQDQADQLVYDTAKEIFWENIEAYSVKRTVCDKRIAEALNQSRAHTDATHANTEARHNRSIGAQPLRATSADPLAGRIFTQKHAPSLAIASKLSDRDRAVGSKSSGGPHEGLALERILPMLSADEDTFSPGRDHTSPPHVQPTVLSAVANTLDGHVGMGSRQTLQKAALHGNLRTDHHPKPSLSSKPLVMKLFKRGAQQQPSAAPGARAELAAAAWRHEIQAHGLQAN